MLGQIMQQKIITVFLILIGVACQAQELTKPIKIRFKDTFQHKYSNTIFPAIFQGEFELKEVHAFDKKKKNVRVTYEKKTKPTAKFNVYIYPADDGTEDRLRSKSNFNAISSKFN